MTSLLPIALQGRVLGERHRHLNTLVSEAYKTNEPLELVLSSPESGPVDRLFKIELASKHRHVDYILQNLRDDDMLYVSRALKSKWLLEDAYRHIMNPHYLEDTLYPNMLTQAVNKMKHWIHLNLTDPATCHRFYQYYCPKDPHIAFKFLLKCPVQVVEQQCSKWFDQMAPEYLKPLCERSALVAEMFFKSLVKNKSLRQKYFKHKSKYFDGLKCVMKADVDIFLDIVDKIKWKFPHLSPCATKYIIKQRKERFLQKSELYAFNILNMETLAQCLSPEESEELVLKLARAKFLEDKLDNFKGWFSYQNVEPLIKRLDSKHRDTFKKRVFVEKNIGETVKEWPYPDDDSEKDYDNDTDDDDNVSNVFDDDDYKPDNIYDYDNNTMPFYVPCSMRYCSAEMADECKMECYVKQKTLLDMLFDEYRFTNFDQTLTELRKKLGAESLPKNRMSMFLVLVSKSGGNMDNLRKLTEFMTCHRNEPAHVRAAVVRSLVKRASVWRVTDDIWESLLEFAEGLGLDGSSSHCKCVEGLHAVVIRSLLSNTDCSSAIKKAFHNNFSTFTSYSLTSTEKDILFNNMVKLLLECAESSSNPYKESCFIECLLDTIRDYKRNVEQDLITHVKTLAAKDKKSAERILSRLFRSKIGRKELFEENFNLIQTGDSYMNALKHNTDILSAEVFVNVVTTTGLNAGYFLRKMNIYFGDKGGLRDLFLIAIKNSKSDNKYKSQLARSLAHLIGNDMKIYISELNAKDSKESKLFSAQIRGHAHVARPALSVDSSEWQQFGAKFIANKVLGCRQADIDGTIKQLLMWRRTAKLAITLSKRTNYEIDTLATVVDLRPAVALKCGLSHIRKQGDKYDPRVWEIIKPLMVKVSKRSFESSNCRSALKKYLREVKNIPVNLRPEFVTICLSIFMEYYKDFALPMLCHANLLLPDIDANIIKNVLLDFYNKVFVLEEFANTDDDYKSNKSYKNDFLHLRILAKYLLLCKSEEIQNERFDNIGLLYLNKIKSSWNSKRNEKIIILYINHFLKSLKYTEVFLKLEYADSIPVMGKITKWMQSFLPMEQYFNYYVDLHLTMSYCRAIRQSVKQAPEAFSDNKTRLNEGVKIVGEIFGRYIGHEAHELRLKYFDSIIELYGNYLQKYLSNYFNLGMHKMEPYILRSLLGSAHDLECYLAIALFNHFIYYGEKKDIDEIRKIMKQRNDIASQFVFHSVMVKHR